MDVDTESYIQAQGSKLRIAPIIAFAISAITIIFLAVVAGYLWYGSNGSNGITNNMATILFWLNALASIMLIAIMIITIVIYIEGVKVVGSKKKKKEITFLIMFLLSIPAIALAITVDVYLWRGTNVTSGIPANTANMMFWMTLVNVILTIIIALVTLIVSIKSLKSKKNKKKEDYSLKQYDDKMGRETEDIKNRLTGNRLEYQPPVQNYYQTSQPYTTSEIDTSRVFTDN